jgi:hypothetical protein
MDLVRLGLERFPELVPRHARLFNEWAPDVPGSYTIFMEIFRPHLAEAINDADTALLMRYGTFFEDVFESQDTEAENVIWLKIFKWLLADHSRVSAFQGYMGKNTKTALKNAARKWNLPKSGFANN